MTPESFGTNFANDLARIREIIEANSRSKATHSARSADGLVDVTVNQQFQVLNVTFHDQSLSDATRAALEKATLEATRAAINQAAVAAASALLQIRVDLNQMAGNASFPQKPPEKEFPEKEFEEE